MPEIDFEKIRQDALEKVCAELPEHPTKPVIRGMLNHMSKLAAEMLIAYHKTVSDADSGHSQTS